MLSCLCWLFLQFPLSVCISLHSQPGLFIATFTAPYIHGYGDKAVTFLLLGLDISQMQINLAEILAFIQDLSSTSSSHFSSGDKLTNNLNQSCFITACHIELS